jgi:hypothetical protein
VSHRFAVPTGDVIPGLNMLLLKDEDPVKLSVMSVTLTIQGEEHGTLGFQEPVPIRNWGALEPTILPGELAGARIEEKSMLARRRIAIPVVRPLRIILFH